MSKNLMFGRLPKKEDPKGRTLKMSNYTAQLPPPPVQSSNLIRITTGLKISDISKLFPMDGNDSLGDCVMAATAHAETVWNGLIGKKKIPTKCAVKRQYKKLTGGPDSGLVMLDTFKTWRTNSFFSEKIDAFVENDITNKTQIMQSIDLFGGIATGMNVQENAVADFNAGKIWTPGKLTGDGHCIWILDYTQLGVLVLTWGGMIWATWDWFNCCVEESYPILPKEAETNGFAPGFPFADLQADLAAVAAA
jgi:hypothetical protein